MEDLRKILLKRYNWENTRHINITKFESLELISSHLMELYKSPNIGISYNGLLWDIMLSCGAITLLKWVENFENAYYLIEIN